MAVLLLFPCNEIDSGASGSREGLRGLTLPITLPLLSPGPSKPKDAVLHYSSSRLSNRGLPGGTSACRGGGCK